ncbi:MAG: ATP-binding protein [Burkholderiaceae bacterium]|nr:ATP-binding protein [Burkholderiaceae bacterium]
MTTFALPPDASGHVVLGVDPATLRITMANGAATALLGYTPSQLLAMTITDIESALHSVFYWEEVSAGQGHALMQQDDLYRCADGELVAVTKSTYALQQADRTVYVVHATVASEAQTKQDVLDQTLSKLRATLESTGNGILVLDWSGHIGSMNRHFGQIWNLPEALLQRQNDAEIVAFLAESVHESACVVARFHELADHSHTEDTLHHLDGRVFELVSRPQYMAEQIVGRVFSVQDVTQRTRDAQALRESRDELELRVRERTAQLETLNADLQAEKERLAELVRELEAAQAQLMQSERMASIGQLAAGVAHEINNPVGFVNSNLGSLKLYVDKLMRLLTVYEQAEVALPADVATAVQATKAEVDLDFMRTDLTELVAESLDGLQRVTRIVQDLKNFSHPDESERQLADIEQGLDSTLRVVWNELKYKATVTKVFAGLPQLVCHPFQLNQVFMNLLVNAGQSIETKGTITLRTGYDDAWLWVEIEDTGKGIKPDNLVRIFDPFFTTKPVGKGTGLGLSMAYGIVKKHGGRIDVRSQVGQGSCFRVWLPREPQPT